MRSLMWFRTDLRTMDNTALVAACRSAGRGPDGGVVGLFVVSPGEWTQHDFAPAKIDLMMRTVRELAASLAKINVPLVVVEAKTLKDVPGVVLRAARECRCDHLFFIREHEVNEAARDAATIVAFETAGLKATACADQCLIEPGEVRTGEGRFYTVFTPFKRAVIKRMHERGVPEVLKAPGKQAEIGVVGTGIREQGTEDGRQATDMRQEAAGPSLWAAGEKHAVKQLGAFCESRIVSYKDSRDFPATPGTSRLSPYLTIGAISHRQCVTAALEVNKKKKLDQGPEGVVSWISEVLWREFYIHIMAGFPRVCMHRAFQPATERIRWSDNDSHFRAWCEGKTGVPIVDAGMRQLLREGWIHNRVRMIVAMFFSKNLFLDWRRGEKWFMQHLVDGFLASNNGGWQWSASTGTDAAPYFRVFNPVSQSRRFDPEGAYIKEYVPELRGIEGDSIHEPWEIPDLLRGAIDYPERPIVDLSESRARAIEAFRGL